MNKFIQKHCLIFLTLISVPVLFLDSKTEDTNSDLVGKKTKEAKKKKGAGFPRVGEEEDPEEGTIPSLSCPTARWRRP